MIQELKCEKNYWLKKIEIFEIYNQIWLQYLASPYCNEYSTMKGQSIFKELANR